MSLNSRAVISLFSVFISIVLLVSCKEEKKYEAITKNDIFTSTALIPDDHFLGDETCKTCHNSEFKDWQGSYHDKAMQIADSTSILADFKGETFTSQEVTSKFYKKNGDYYVNTEGPDGAYQDYKIVYTYGVTPLQQYIVQFPNGAFQCLSTAWDSVEKKWFNLFPDFRVVHDEWLHWTNKGLNWNTMCSDCHSTNVRKNYSLKNDSYDTKYALINVNCEACHGPGKQHVDDVKRLGKTYAPTGTMKMTSNIEPKQLVDECARCHARREQFTENYNYQGSFLDHYFPHLIVEPQYYPDGQILDEDYVYTSFVQSKMYKNDVACNNCHNSHSLKLKMEGNALCTQCHVPARYNTSEHHKHEMGTESAACINCHMPGRYYMGNDFRRDHSFRVPRPDLSLNYNAPNACVGCHETKDNTWAWESFQKLYGTVDSLHFSDKLAPGVLGVAHADAGLIDLIHNTSENELVRASALRALSNYDMQQHIDEYITRLNDASPLVRATSVDVLSNINNTDYLNYLLPLLKDPKRTVRVKTFYALAGVNELQIPEEYKEVYTKVKKEFDTYINLNTDFAGGLARKGNYYIKQGNLQQAIFYYEKALEVDNLENNLRLTLANLYYNTGDYKKAEDTFKLIIQQEPEYGPTYYSLALLLAELNREEEAITYLEQTIIKMPEYIRAYYNLSLLYDKLNQPNKAESILAKGLKVDSNNESLLYALAYHYANLNNESKAKNIAKRLVELYPSNQQYAVFYQQLSNVQ
ncbi:tetratricopeptide repeat protein [Aestuariibaculum suncheonense]|uniref:Tetratricopeptide repeat protein n=1 Tax=Aestuariibaculum suncheonense TaxID=1028745 RepID=A0A8J6Q8K8_9FLAO|nr:tetratricopeptide repeat protein [Aestuariibaculum suncheonense]